MGYFLLRGGLQAASPEADGYAALMAICTVLVTGLSKYSRYSPMTRSRPSLAQSEQEYVRSGLCLR